ncbi:MAG: hypothetical protein M3389_06580 [Actinomycetota bacterium]|nr:hypothetical protein [Actinomycetota bacterium]
MATKPPSETAISAAVPWPRGSGSGWAGAAQLVGVGAVAQAGLPPFALALEEQRDVVVLAPVGLARGAGALRVRQLDLGGDVALDPLVDPQLRWVAVLDDRPDDGGVRGLEALPRLLVGARAGAGALGHGERGDDRDGSAGEERAHAHLNTTSGSGFWSRPGGAVSVRGRA